MTGTAQRLRERLDAVPLHRCYTLAVVTDLLTDLPELTSLPEPGPTAGSARVTGVAYLSHGQPRQLQADAFPLGFIELSNQPTVSLCGQESETIRHIDDGSLRADAA